MHTLALEWQAIWKIVVVGLLLGAGLPALFAAGIRASAGTTTDPDADRPTSAAPLVGRVVGALCFTAVAALVALGLLLIVVDGLGKEVSFEHLYPVVRDA